MSINTIPAPPGQDEILGGSHCGGGGEPETGLVIDHPNPHPFLCHCGIMPGSSTADDGVDTTLSMVRTRQF
jgi:hypothetical protein